MEKGKGKIEFAVFDVDGTLLDTESIYTLVTNKVLEKYNLTLQWSLKQELMGRPALDSCRHLCAKLQLPCAPEDFLAERRMYEDIYMPTAEFLPGAKELVLHLKKCGVKMAVATSARRCNYEAKAARHKDVFDLFDAVVCGDDPRIKKGKPAPDIFLLAAETLNPAFLDRLEAGIVFEDAVSGVQAGLASGMHVVAVPDVNLLDNPANLPIFQQADNFLKSLADFDPLPWGLPPMDQH